MLREGVEEQGASLHITAFHICEFQNPMGDFFLIIQVVSTSKKSRPPEEWGRNDETEC